MNNYNSLGAVVAGLSSTAIHRLSQTRDLIPVHIRKEYIRLEILMGTQRSHFAYRLAWDNTPTERIPFLPLHRRDLVSGEEGNLTFLDEQSTLINWPKFEKLGAILESIQKAQDDSYPPITRNPEIHTLFMDTRISKDEDVSLIETMTLRILRPVQLLYARSLHVESASIGEAVRKRLNWLQR